MKKVLIITYYWPPSGGAGVQRWVKFVKYMSQMGLAPIVLTVDPKYASYPQKDETLCKDVPGNVKVYLTKSFELYSVYKKVSSNKEIPYGGFANTKTLDFKEKIIRFIRGNFFLPDPRKGWNKFAYQEATRIIKNHNIDSVITTSPPHSTQLIGLKLKKRLKINWIADLRDPWTDIYYYKQLYPTWLATAIQKQYELRVIKKCDKLLTVSDALKKLFIEKDSTISNKVHVLPNGYDPDDFDIKIFPEKNDIITISYIGTMSEDYTINGFIDGINMLDSSIKNKLRIRFVGKMSDKINESFILAGLASQVETIGYVNHKRAIEFMYTSDILLLVIPNIVNNLGILTGKLYEYLAVNRPILLIGPEQGDAAKIIQETNSGVTCDYYDSSKIRNSIQILSQRSKDIIDEPLPSSASLKYSRITLTKELIKLL
ncbi:glycosyltransferase family 4 protein [Maribellus sp. YY47]|uniref:glycosyltransferase family 4 protein n=1 Tax=Maribellus sp. YY47 TaxID=2929486 RepID=UPI0020018CDC|nr:glycosyltransferase family 4 protein [Maribellus sp. YY47]MCK3683756.1 glycosyltransferase family 4 protein [Maribellus sp. YY47]